MSIEKVEAFKCSNGILFLNEEDANRHEYLGQLERIYEDDTSVLWSKHGCFEDLEQWLRTNREAVMGFLGGENKDLLEISQAVSIMQVVGLRSSGWHFVDESNWRGAYNNLMKLNGGNTINKKGEG